MSEDRATYHVDDEYVTVPQAAVRCICGTLCLGNHWPYRNDPEGQFAHHVQAMHASQDPEHWRFAPVGPITRRLAAVR